MIAYYHSEKYGPLGYLDINNFCCIKSVKSILPIIENYLYIARKADSQKIAMTESELVSKTS
jgi:hypothetical protein